MSNDAYRKPTETDLFNYAKAWVDRLYNDFQSPRFRGPNFRWSNFPETVRSLATAGLKMSYDSDQQDENKLSEIVIKLATDKAKDEQ